MVFKASSPWERRPCIITTTFSLFSSSFYTNSSLISALDYIYKLFISFVKELWTIQVKTTFNCPVLYPKHKGKGQSFVNTFSFYYFGNVPISDTWEHKFSSDEQNQVWEGLKKQQPHCRAAIHGIVSEEQISALPAQEILHSCNFGSSHSPVKPLKANWTEGKIQQSMCNLLKWHNWQTLLQNNMAKYSKPDIKRPFSQNEYGLKRWQQSNGEI